MQRFAHRLSNFRICPLLLGLYCFEFDAPRPEQAVVRGIFGLYLSLR